MYAYRNIIVIGASAGGIPAISKVLAGLPKGLDAAVLVVLHLSRNSNGKIIVRGFQKCTSLICSVANDGEVIKKGHLYLALPDHQLMVAGDKIRVTNGPHENRYRPSIDVLFRSCAVHYGHRVIGIILTGLLEDGTSGMSAIKRSGGICIVQDPSEAQYGDMPQSVLNQIEVDYKAGLSEIPLKVEEVRKRPLPPVVAVPQELKIEAEITENVMSDINQLKRIADHSDFICPSCGGGLWAIKNDPMHRYRCHTGHVYTEKLLYDEQGEHVEESIWVSVRMLEERRNLLLLMCSHAKEEGRAELADVNQLRADEMNKHIRRLKTVLSKLTEDLDDPERVMNNN
jgi:two-component system chemotaxis response regulator CheB